MPSRSAPWPQKSASRPRAGPREPPHRGPPPCSTPTPPWPATSPHGAPPWPSTPPTPAQSDPRPPQQQKPAPTNLTDRATRPRPTRPGRHTLGPLATSIDPRLTTDPYSPQLADRLTAAGRAGLDVAALAIAVAADQALPDEQPAAALWWRLARHLSPAALHASPTHTATTLRPAWTPLHTTLFTDTTADRVINDPAWPALVAAVTNAPRSTAGRSTRSWAPPTTHSPADTPPASRCGPTKPPPHSSGASARSPTLPPAAAETPIADPAEQPAPDDAPTRPAPTPPPATPPTRCPTSTPTGKPACNPPTTPSRNPPAHRHPTPPATSSRRPAAAKSAQ